MYLYFCFLRICGLFTSDISSAPMTPLRHRSDTTLTPSDTSGEQHLSAGVGSALAPVGHGEAAWRGVAAQGQCGRGRVG